MNNSTDTFASFIYIGFTLAHTVWPPVNSHVCTLKSEMSKSLPSLLSFVTQLIDMITKSLDYFSCTVYIHFSGCSVLQTPIINSTDA